MFKATGRMLPPELNSCPMSARAAETNNYDNLGMEESFNFHIAHFSSFNFKFSSPHSCVSYQKFFLEKIVNIHLHVHFS